jgi:hypothetical protein
MTKVVGKRLTYKRLIGEEPHTRRTRTTA